ncbi:hypothetical protein G6F56_013112 [Rhizopus delemar]|nr:hypothetical protein G6F56_013112 [Rhizopus delemar]
METLYSSFSTSLSNDNQGIAGGKQSSNKLLRYVSEPKDFGGNVKGGSGDLTTEAHVWLNRMSRFKKSAGLSDQDILFIASDHLVDKAETWWNVVGSKAGTWQEFIEVFKKQYLTDQEDMWWRQLQGLKQGTSDSIDDVALKMEELFGLLKADSNSFKVRTFLNAINPTIAS